MVEELRLVEGKEASFFRIGLWWAVMRHGSLIFTFLLTDILNRRLISYEDRDCLRFPLDECFSLTSLRVRRECNQPQSLNIR